MAGTAISAIKYIKIANKIVPKTTASVMVSAFHVSPADLPAMTAPKPSAKAGINKINSTMTLAIPITMRHDEVLGQNMNDRHYHEENEKQDEQNNSADNQANEMVRRRSEPS